MLKSIDSAPDSGTVMNRPEAMARAQEFPTAATELPLPVKALSPQPGVENRSGERASAADLLAEAGDLSDPAARDRVVASLRALEVDERDSAQARARALGLPLRIALPGGGVKELVRFKDGRPIYYITHNATAAISTGSNLLARSPFSANGGGTVGVWDAGAVRASHVEFTGRVTVMDGSKPDDHATHVAGTIAAAGILPSARGMANAAGIHSYDWLNDRSEMLARGASYPVEPGRIAISNHSYGILSGWQTTGQKSPAWRWHGSGTGSSGMEGNFGKYGNAARDVDALAHSLPYYLVFRSAGNDRNDDPAAGDPVALSSSSGSTISYNPANHPAGDGVYRGGYDTLSHEAVGKNVITIGAVNDAVNGGLRDTTRATITSFSSWGPTDDGRIKPDLVANGATVYSPLGGSDTSYGVYSGTSMAAPNASGTAQQLIDFHQQLHPGQALRASTLKALLIHSADDLGRPGPDYQFGWGLINGHAAAAKLLSYHQSPATREVVESRLTSTRPSHTESFFWDGLSPIRATLAWSDPAASMVFGNDSRTPRLVNDLDLRIVGPDGSEHFSFMMPFVGNWSSASFSSPATTGVNRTDNVEQVLIAKPPHAGVYTVSVTFSGSLAGGAQGFSLILSGAATGGTAPPPTLSSVSASTKTRGPVALTLTGENLRLGARISLSRKGLPEVMGAHLEISGDTAKARFDTGGQLGGAWDVLIRNPDGSSATLPGAFVLAPAAQNQAPFIAVQASALPASVTGNHTLLEVTADDDSGMAGLSHTWTSSGPAAVEFSVNGSHAAKATRATFSRAGSYHFTVTVRDAAGLATSSSVSVSVLPTIREVAVLPAEATLTAMNRLEFSTSAIDQFGDSVPLLLPTIWSVDHGGAITPLGVFEAGGEAGESRITASVGGISGAALVLISPAEGVSTALAGWLQASGLSGAQAHPDADPDGDGFSNKMEFHLGTAPDDANSRLTLQIDPDAGGGSLRLFINPIVSTGLLEIQSAPAPSGPWSTVAIPAPGAGHLDVPRSDGSRFFQLRYAPPMAD